MGGFLRQLLAPGTKAPRWFMALVVALLSVTAWWYVREATRHGDSVSARWDREFGLECKVMFKGDKLAMEKAKRPVHAYNLNDQRVYMNYAMGMRENSFRVFVTRMRMPMFTWLLALEADGTPRQGLNWEELERGYVAFYPDARAFNIQLSLVLLVAMFFALRPWLGNWMGIAFTLMAAFQLFILKSPYVQPEVLQTAIVTVTVAWIVRTLADPKWWNALVTGLLLCFWHMTKANALVAVGLMGTVMGVKLFFSGAWPKYRVVIVSVLVVAALMAGVAWSIHELRDPLAESLGKRLKHVAEANAYVLVGLGLAVLAAKVLLSGSVPDRRAIIIAGLVTITAYILPMSPYLYNSWKVFGDPFYNVQSKFYMWGSDVDDKHDLQDMGLDRNFDHVDLDHDGKIDHPELLPSAGKYWREHTWDEIRDRLRRGVEGMFDNAFEEYTPLHWLQMVWAGILVWAASRRWHDTVDAVMRWKWEMLYVAVLLSVFVYFFGWFTKLNVGPRLLNSISLLPLFFCMAGTRWLLRRDTVTVRGVTLSTEKLLVVCFIATWFALTACVLPSDLENGFFAG